MAIVRDGRVGVVERRDVGVVLPDRIRRRADVGAEPTGVGEVQVTHRGGHHHDVAGAEVAGEDQIARAWFALTLRLTTSSGASHGDLPIADPLFHHLLLCAASIMSVWSSNRF